MQENFDKYVHNFDMKDEIIKAKYNHSYRVMKLSEKYARKLNFSKEDIEIAKIIGLLHDYGRFIQIKQYHTMKDSIIDHADLGIKLLFENKEIEKFNIPQKYYDIIKFAIKNHNKFYIDKTEDKRKLMHAKLIRDADKMDILFLFGYCNDLKLKETDEPITKEVLECVKKHQLVDIHLCKNPNDHIITKFSFVFDINYDEFLKEFKENLTKFYDRLQYKHIYEQVYMEALKYIDERIDNHVR